MEYMKLIRYLCIGGHGTHVCGSIAGQCLNGEFDSDGIAPESKISFYDVGNLNTEYLSASKSYEIFGSPYLTGARIHSNSWGARMDSVYNSESYEIDQISHDNPDYLIIFAAGNDGDTVGKGSLGSQAVAKNCLTVGALTNRLLDGDEVLTELTIAYYSSLGPTSDGRFGVDLVAPGDYIMSAGAGPVDLLREALESEVGGDIAARVIEKSGTSMATPVVAGTAILVRQYFMDPSFWATLCVPGQKYCCSFTPTAAMLKAVLINSGTAVDRYSLPYYNNNTKIPSFYLGAPPDIYQGFGKVTLSNCLPLHNGKGLAPNLKLFVYDNLQVSSGGSYFFKVHIPVSGTFKATIVWTDSPLPVPSSKYLVNDIDLLIQTPTSTSPAKYYWGNGVPNGDDANNVEQVTVTATTVGDYFVYILAHSFPDALIQNVALVFTYPFSSTSYQEVYGPSTTTKPTVPEASTVTFAQY